MILERPPVLRNIEIVVVVRNCRAGHPQQLETIKPIQPEGNFNNQWLISINHPELSMNFSWSSNWSHCHALTISLTSCQKVKQWQQPSVNHRPSLAQFSSPTITRPKRSPLSSLSGSRPASAHLAAILSIVAGRFCQGVYRGSCCPPTTRRLELQATLQELRRISYESSSWEKIHGGWMTKEYSRGWY